MIVHYWKCRAHRRQGEYELALHHIQSARAIAQQMGAPRSSPSQIFMRAGCSSSADKSGRALRLLDEAEAEFKSTGHALSLGNIESARGRFVRRSGEYTRALAHFERAVEIYGENYADHPNRARALVNAAYVKRLIALDLRNRSYGRAKGVDHVRYLEILQEALELLRRAGDIYSRQHHQAGTGSVLVNAGHLHLDSGDIDRAEGRGAESLLAR